MITNYNIAYNEKPQIVAKAVRETNTLNVRISRHVRSYRDQVADTCTFHLWNGETYTREDFLKKF